MSYLIDRQAVIDLLKQMRKDGDMVPWEGRDVFARIRKLPTIQPEKEQLSCGGTTSDLISKFIDGLEEIFADIRERHVDDSVCGLCEYDGAYMGQSGDWCNECPGFDRDDCFKLSDETRKKWTEEIIKALPTVQPELTDEQAIAHLQSSGWMQRHDKEMYKSGLREQLADDSDSYDSLLPSAQPEPQEGHWIEVAGELECSEYHTVFTDLYPDYADSVACPHCGAKMTISK